MINSETTYVPFEDGLLQARVQKCEICNANMNADCHAHASYCPYSCGYQEDNVNGNLPVGDSFFAFGMFISIYIVWKFKRK